MRTPEALYRKHEQLLDAEERGALTPKQMEQMNTTLKAMYRIGIETPLRMMGMVVKLKGRAGVAGAAEGMRAPMFRLMLGLPEIAGKP